MDEAAQNNPTEITNENEAAPSDVDVNYGDSTTWHSLTGTVMRHTFENGRRYHNFMQGHYILPNDDQEQYREELAHLLFIAVLDGDHYLAPIGSNPQRIIDLGTGTGAWAIEMADAFPGAEVVGVDLSPIQPDWCPPNLQFHVDNVEDEWAYGSGFDYVHLRHMCQILKSPGALLTTAYDNMKSGGWIELQDLYMNIFCDDCVLPQDHVLVKSCTFMLEALKCIGFDIDFVKDIPLGLEKAGFTNVYRKIFNVPVGSWPENKKERYFGLMAREVLGELPELLASKLFKHLDLPQSEVDAIVSGAEDAYAHTEHRIFVKCGVVYAQKP